MKPLFKKEEIEKLKWNELLPFQCYNCKNTFYTNKKTYIFESNHPERGRIKFCSQSCNNELNNKNLKQKVKCKSCNKEFWKKNSEMSKTKSGNHFCSKSCSAIFNNTQRTKKIFEKQSQSLKKAFLKNKIILTKNCLCCKKNFEIKKSKKQIFCSRSCSTTYKNNNNKDILRKAGLKSCNIQKETRRSKNEIFFAELCKKHFINVLTNEPIFNGWDADVVLPDFKIAILWNGIWHYKKIKKKHSVEQVQARDKYKIKQIENCGYKHYTIKDTGKKNEDFVKKEFEKFLKYFSLELVAGAGNAPDVFN